MVCSVALHTVKWSWYRFADFTRLEQLSPCVIIHMSLYVLSQITAWTKGWPLLPVFRNRGKNLPRPLMFNAHSLTWKSWRNLLSSLLYLFTISVLLYQSNSKWRACFQNLLHPPPTCYSFALLTPCWNEKTKSLIKYVPIVCFFH